MKKDTGRVLDATDATINTVHETSVMALISMESKHGIEQMEITCPRCREIMNRALKLLHPVAAMKMERNDFLSILCDHCKLCQMASEKIIGKYETTENAKERVKDWLSKLDKLALGERQISKKLNKTRSETHIDKLLNKEYDSSEQDPVISELICKSSARTRTHSLERHSERISCKENAMVDPSGKNIKLLSSKIGLLLEHGEQFHSDLDNTFGTSMSIPGATKNYSEGITEGRNQALKNVSFVSFQGEDEFAAYKNESVSDDIVFKNIVSKPAKMQKRQHSEDDIIPNAHSKQHAHNYEKVSPYNQKVLDKHDIQSHDFDSKVEDTEQYETKDLSKALSRRFSFSFPQEKGIEEKNKRLKSSSELITETRAKLLAKAEEGKEQQKIKLQVEENKQIARQDKAKVAEDKNIHTAEIKKANEKRKLDKNNEREQILQKNITPLYTYSTTTETKDLKQKTTQKKSKPDVKEVKDSNEYIKEYIKRDEKPEKQLQKESKQKLKESKLAHKETDKLNSQKIKDNKPLLKNLNIEKEKLQKEKELHEKKQTLERSLNETDQKNQKVTTLDASSIEKKTSKDPRKIQGQSLKDTKLNKKLGQTEIEKSKKENKESTADLRRIQDQSLKDTKLNNKLGQTQYEKHIKENKGSIADLRKLQGQSLKDTKLNNKLVQTQNEKIKQENKELTADLRKIQDQSVKDTKLNNKLVHTQHEKSKKENIASTADKNVTKNEIERKVLNEKEMIDLQKQLKRGRKDDKNKEVFEQDNVNSQKDTVKEGKELKKNKKYMDESNLNTKVDPKIENSQTLDLSKNKILSASHGNIAVRSVTKQKEAQPNVKGVTDTKGLEYMLKQRQARGKEESKNLPQSREIEDTKNIQQSLENERGINEKALTLKEINIEGIELLLSSQDCIVLELEKIKQSCKTKIFLSDLMTPLEIKNHKISHKHIKDDRCFMCLHSDIELNYDIRKTQINPITDIIKCQEIVKCKYLHTDEIENQELVPLLFRKEYDVIDLPIPEPDNIAELPSAAPPNYSLPLRPTGKSIKLLTDSEVETKGVTRYALSDRSFIEKGWTMLPTEKVVRKMNVYRMRPSHPEFDWFKHNKSKGLMNYDTGERLAEFDDNGRGRWYYRNGRLALDYYDAEELNAQQRFVIFSTGQPDERGRSQPYTIIATFDFLGNGIVFDHSGKIRLKYNQTEGVVLDRNIGPVSHWKWHTLNDPPVLQQVMIDTQMPHKDPDILKMGGTHDDKTRQENEEMLAIEYDNFIKEKSKKLTQSFKPFQIKMKALKINENFSLKILDQATVYLIFRDGTTNLKLNIGMVLDHKEIVDTDTAEVGEVSNNLERFPAITDSLAELQKSVAYAQRFERSQTERERRLLGPLLVPYASADKLTAAVSRPLRQPLRSLHSSSSRTTVPTNCYSICNRKPASNIYYDNRLL